jgi:stage V sporulation protein AD
MKIGRQTIEFKNKPAIIAASTLVGPKETEGYFKDYFKHFIKDDTFGEKTFEKSEREMLIYTIKTAIDKTKYSYSDIDVIIGGDLLNQIISATFSAREFKVPFLGIYSACATYCQALILGASMVDSCYRENAVCCTSSHFSSAERQYRFPLELGTMRTPAQQWTVTGAGASVLKLQKGYPYIKCATIGKVIDYGINDANNMGAAMAPAAMDTIVNHFKETQTSHNDYDLIVTGDLGLLGSNILCDLMLEKGYDIKSKHMDCGAEIFKHEPLMHQGGSGAACSAVVFNAYLYEKLIRKEYKCILFVATGALLSPVTSWQGETIPGIAHAVAVYASEN